MDERHHGSRRAAAARALARRRVRRGGRRLRQALGRHPELHLQPRGVPDYLNGGPRHGPPRPPNARSAPGDPWRSSVTRQDVSRRRARMAAPRTAAAAPAAAVPLAAWTRPAIVCALAAGVVPLALYLLT